MSSISPILFATCSINNVEKVNDILRYAKEYNICIDTKTLNTCFKASDHYDIISILLQYGEITSQSINKQLVSAILDNQCNIALLLFEDNRTLLTHDVINALCSMRGVINSSNKSNNIFNSFNMTPMAIKNIELLFLIKEIYFYGFNGFDGFNDLIAPLEIIYFIFKNTL